MSDEIRKTINRMKKPLFNEVERQIMHKDKSLYASTMKLRIATKKFEKAFMKTFFGRSVEKTVDWLARLFSADVSQVDVNAKWECCTCGWIGTHSESADKTPVVNDAWLLVCPKCGNKDEFYACS